MEEKSLRHKFSFSKSCKIRKSFEYAALKRSKKRVDGQSLAIGYRFNAKLEMPRLGITLSSKLAKAHIRNKFKRIIREIFRLNKHLLPKDLEINVFAKSLSKDLNYFEIEKDFLDLISSINNKNKEPL